jgi:guanosine-diphosphatase
MRRISVSLPTNNNHPDPHEKLARFASSPKGTSPIKEKYEEFKAAWMTQGQRARYIKTGGILLFVVFLFYFLAPKSTHIGGTGG